jgi:hypothetical protein
LAAKFEIQALPLAAAASGGDIAALGKLQALQVAMMREWLSSYGVNRGKASKP